MQIKGQVVVAAERSRVWRTLIDPAALEGCLPGVQRFESVGPGQWDVTLAVALAGIKGSYNGRVVLDDERFEEGYRLSVEGSGSGNRVKGVGLVALADTADGGTTIAYDGDVQIAGTLAVVGQRLLQPAARMLAEQYFKCMEARVKGA